MSSSKKSTLRSRFLESLSGGERDHVFALTRELSVELEQWVNRYPFMRAVRVPQLGLTLAATASFLGVRELLPAARLSMWLFAMDDLCDEGSAEAGGEGDARPWARLERCVSVLEEPQGAGPGGEDLLLVAMREIRDELAGFPLFAALRPALVESLRQGLRGMRLEDEWSARYRESPEARLLSSREYLEEAGLYSIGVLPVYVCMLATMGDGAILPHLPQLLELGREVSRAIRLANDLRSYERELAEGKLNTLILLRRELLEAEPGLEHGQALERTRAEVKARMSAALERCLELGKPERIGSARPGQYAADLVSFVCDFYAHHDFHHPLIRQDS